MKKIYNKIKEVLETNEEKIHNFTGYFVAVILLAAIFSVCNFCETPMEASFVIVFILGMFKEIFDKISHGHSSIKDIVAGMFGMITALISIVLISQ